MEKNQQSRDAEVAMNLAAARADTVIDQYGVAAVEYACGMASQNLEEQENSCRSFETTRNNAVTGSIQNRLARLDNFNSDAHKMIEDTNLQAPENIARVNNWLNAKNQQATNRNHNATTQIREKNIQLTNSANTKYKTHKSRCNEKLTDLNSYAKRQKFITGFNNYKSQIFYKLGVLETSLNLDTKDMNQILNYGYRQLLDTIDSNESHQKNQLNDFKSELRQLLKHLKHTERQQDSKKNNTGTNDNSKHETHKSNTKTADPRIRVLMGNRTDESVKPYEIILVNIDHHRQKGKTDQEIYRLMVRHFHPDISDHTYSEQVIRGLTAAYDAQNKRFAV